MNSRPKSIIKLCRLCASDVDETNQNELFDKSNKFILEHIKELTGIIVKDMPRQLLPRYFCGQCKKDLPNACEFRRKIIKTQSYFKSKEYKIKFDTQIKPEPPPPPTLVLADEHTIEQEDATVTEYMGTMEIKDEITENSTSENDENPISFNKVKVAQLKTHKNYDVEIVDETKKTSHTTTANTGTGASQEFDAVFIPLKKDGDDDHEKLLHSKSDISVDDDDDDDDNESDKDALEDFSPGESEDPNFFIGLDLKKKYKKKPKELTKAKPEMPKDPRKNPLFCYICNTTLKTLHAFKVHCRKLHKGEKVFKCDSCEETFLRIKSLIRHSRIHTGGKLFECRYCDMSFNAPTTRIHHERAKHTKDWPFLCPICGKAFITTTRGKEHMTVHTKERPYKCELCKTAYLQRNNFKKHRRSELHKNNEKKLKESTMDTGQNKMSSNENEKNDSIEK